jgi:hypothetical protein
MLEAVHWVRAVRVLDLVEGLVHDLVSVVEMGETMEMAEDMVEGKMELGVRMVDKMMGTVGGRMELGVRMAYEMMEMVGEMVEEKARMELGVTMAYKMMGISEEHNYENPTIQIIETNA